MMGMNTRTPNTLDLDHLADRTSQITQGEMTFNMSQPPLTHFSWQPPLLFSPGQRTQTSAPLAPLGLRAAETWKQPCAACLCGVTTTAQKNASLRRRERGSWPTWPKRRKKEAEGAAKVQGPQQRVCCHSEASGLDTRSQRGPTCPTSCRL